MKSNNNMMTSKKKMMTSKNKISRAVEQQVLCIWN